MKITKDTPLKKKAVIFMSLEKGGYRHVYNVLDKDGNDTGVSYSVTAETRKSKPEQIFFAVASPEDNLPTEHDNMHDAFKAAGHEVDV